ncbi:MAG: multiheme c-type cytochrome [Campylobacterota bacterium]
MKLFFTIFVISFFATYAVAEYPSSESCNECHENIYREHTNSMHHKSTIFNNEVHRKVKNIASPDKYKCAICHMPATKYLRAVMNGDEQPNPNKHRQADGVSCFFCH